MGETECRQFWVELIQGWEKRASLIGGCLNVIGEGVKKETHGVESGLDRIKRLQGRGETELQVKVSLPPLSLIESNTHDDE